MRRAKGRVALLRVEDGGLEKSEQGVKIAIRASIASTLNVNANSGA
jgi:hypothetical protein